MMQHVDKNTREAILVMESRGASGVRTTSAQTHWSRLYQLGGYYLDMTFKVCGKRGTLQGQLLSSDPVEQSGTTLSLVCEGKEQERYDVDAEGAFSLDLPQPGQYRLSVATPTDLFSITDLVL